jgi:hypothetical protein
MSGSCGRRGRTTIGWTASWDALWRPVCRGLHFSVSGSWRRRLGRGYGFLISRTGGGHDPSHQCATAWVATAYRPGLPRLRMPPLLHDLHAALPRWHRPSEAMPELREGLRDTREDALNQTGDFDREAAAASVGKRLNAPTESDVIPAVGSCSRLGLFGCPPPQPQAPSFALGPRAPGCTP